MSHGASLECVELFLEPGLFIDVQGADDGIWREAQVVVTQDRRMFVTYINERQRADEWLHVDIDSSRMAEFHTHSARDYAQQQRGLTREQREREARDKRNHAVTRVMQDQRLTRAAALQGLKRYFKTGSVLDDEADDDEADDDEDDDDEVMMEHVRIPLYDPVSHLRIRVPVRGRVCAHVDVFDLATYVEMRGVERLDEAGKCPICRRKMRRDELLVDEYLLELVEENNRGVSRAVMERMYHGALLLHADGRHQVEQGELDKAAASASASSSSSSAAAVVAQEEEEEQEEEESDYISSDEDEAMMAHLNKLASSKPANTAADAQAQASKLAAQLNLDVPLFLPGKTTVDAPVKFSLRAPPPPPQPVAPVFVQARVKKSNGHKKRKHGHQHPAQQPAKKYRPVPSPQQPVQPQAPGNSSTDEADTALLLLLNYGTKRKLKKLPRVGSTTANRIMSSRPFPSLADVSRMVPRLSQHTVDNFTRAYRQDWVTGRAPQAW